MLLPSCFVELNVSRWLYAAFLAVDANFRMKLKNRCINDPETGSGWTYFVENQRYTEHVSQKTHEKEVSPFRLRCG